ncbi:MAG: site-specific DNA-methyltransferase [Anaerolineae bacterium]|nr:site-specific DNA-methyltransferase [Anaerolineae bacterium]
MMPLWDTRKPIEAAYHPDAEVVLYPGDVQDFLRDVPDETVSLILTSPPYNLGKAYENRVAIEAYLDSQRPIIAELGRVLKAGGSLCWQVGNFVEDGEVFPLDMLYYNLFKQQGLKLRNRIVWHFEHGLHAQKRFSGRYEMLLWFTKGDEYTFNLDPVRVPSKYPGKRHFKGPNKGKPSGNPLGKNPSDLWRFLIEEWEEGIWEIPNVKSNHPEKTIHPCQFPVELVERCVLAFTNAGEWVLDPFAGVGSTLIGAVRHQRRAMGAEKEPEYARIARERLNAQFDGVLRTRPLGKPVHQPSGREKVSQVPSEWVSDRNGTEEG